MLRAESIFVGPTAEDGNPDRQPKYFSVFNELIRLGTRTEKDIKIVTPLSKLPRRQVVKRAFDLGVPLQHTWTCYQTEGPVACGRCQSCVRRLQTFEDAGKVDPLQYATRERVGSVSSVGEGLTIKGNADSYIP